MSNPLERVFDQFLISYDQKMPPLRMGHLVIVHWQVDQ